MLDQLQHLDRKCCPVYNVYEHCLSLIRWSRNYTSHDVPLVQHAFAGALASIAATVTYAPIDRLKSLRQVETKKVFLLNFSVNH